MGHDDCLPTLCVTEDEDCSRAEFDDELDGMAAALYNARAQSPRDMTPARWRRIKRRFPGSVRIAVADAQDMLEDDD